MSLQVRTQTNEELAARLERVFDREGIPTEEQQSLATPFLEWLDGLLSEFGYDNAGDVLMFGVVAVLVIALAIVIWRVARQARWTRQSDGKAVERRRRAQELYASSREALAQGDIHLATRLALFALVVALGEGGELTFRAAWTDRELLERGRPKEAVLARLTSLVDELEPRLFGREPVREADLSRVDDEVRALAPEVAR